MKKKGKLATGHPYLYLLPAIAVILLLSVYPLVWNFVSSLNDDDGSFRPLFQYQKLFTSPAFFNALHNTFVWVVAGVGLMVIIGFGLALIFNIKFRGRLLVRSIAMVPYAIPAIAISAIWKWMFNADYGILNHILRSLGVIDRNILWLANPDTALWSVIIVNVWKMFPFVMLMFLSGLQTIPLDIYESSAIDGVGPVRRLFNITIPLLFPVVRSTLLLLTIWTFNSFTYIYNITRGGPAQSSEVLSLYVYRVGIKEFNHSLSAASAVVLFLLSLIFTILFVVLTNKSEENVRK